jgi:hypothetical protein
MPETDLALDLARRVTQRAAPDELPLLADMDAQLLSAGPLRRSDILDFGIAEVAAVLSPVIVVAANAMVSEAANRASGAIVDGIAKFARRLAARLGIARPRGPLVVIEPGKRGSPRLSVRRKREGELRRLVRRCARRAGLPKEQARLLEAAFIAELSQEPEDH